MDISRVSALCRLAPASAIALALGGVALPTAAQEVLWGEAVAVGNGQARVAITEAAPGVPASVAVVMTADALEGLPGEELGQEGREYVLPMPADGTHTGYDHVGLNWHPIGHIPDGIYTVAHFDVHFYLIDETERQAISFLGPDREQRLAPPDPALVPEGYVIPPDTAVERMGLHGLDPESHEFQGQPFTRTFLYGYESGRLIFLEPMITLDYLQTRQDLTLPVKTPAAYGSPGYFPSSYRVGFEPEAGEYWIELRDLRPFEGAAPRPLQGAT
ncbi:DUF5602 domain-containing protein [Halomonas beimenensis]|uniref:Cupin domain protein related to quercetin dioxygenase n=1 Tax=Halomonas beimenensis TaxID=475662 RepID=A0A291PB26_9GAMM|nr:DUF5602 domain-containing protein [Halomonas beimenensis]ATJ84075.1 cupin domain protein related to quercetin dioxygenase [Halomonas beimenensis]